MTGEQELHLYSVFRFKIEINPFEQMKKIKHDPWEQIHQGNIIFQATLHHYSP